MKGYRCDTASGRLAHARKIVDLIKKVPVSVEEQSLVVPEAIPLQQQAQTVIETSIIN